MTMNNRRFYMKLCLYGLAMLVLAIPLVFVVGHLGEAISSEP